MLQRIPPACRPSSLHYALRCLRRRGVLLLVVAVVWAAPNLISLISEQLLQQVEQQHGKDARTRVDLWRKLMLDGGGDNWATLNKVNRYFNGRVKFISDSDNWKQEDYWATPLELLIRARGDCEDYSIAKYFTLVSLGVPREKLRLMYVRALEPNQPHMVLTYYETPEDIPLVLDNLNGDILPADERSDLEPIYSFNGEGLWMAKAQGRGRQLRQDSGAQLWESLVSRIEAGQ